jgi:Uma2 family endonuclease
MATRQQTTGLTYTDIEDWPEERRELLDGEFVVTPSPRPRHQEVVGELYLRIRLWLTEHPGKVYVAPLDVYLSETNVLQPDLVFLSGEHLSNIEEKFVRSAPDLVVEVSSPSTRRLELVRKRELYERFGVPEYWFVDLDGDRVEVYRREGEGFSKPILLGRTEELESPILPGFAVSIDELLGSAEPE